MCSEYCAVSAQQHGLGASAADGRHSIRFHFMHRHIRTITHGSMHRSISVLEDKDDDGKEKEQNVALRFELILCSAKHRRFSLTRLVLSCIDLVLLVMLRFGTGSHQPCSLYYAQSE